MSVEYIIKYLEKLLAYIHYMPRFYPIHLKNYKNTAVYMYNCRMLLTTNFLAPPFYRISGLITALGEVSYGCTETFTVSSAITSVQ